jgi:hypothetical protein
MLLTLWNLNPRKKIRLSYHAPWQFEDFHGRQKRRCAPLSGVKRTWRLHCKCLLLTQSGHWASLNEPHLNRYDIPPVLEGGYEATRISQRFK